MQLVSLQLSPSGQAMPLKRLVVVNTMFGVKTSLGMVGVVAVKVTRLSLVRSTFNDPSHASCKWLSCESQKHACKGQDVLVQTEFLKKPTSGYGNCDTACMCEKVNVERGQDVCLMSRGVSKPLCWMSLS